jgi:hypothetical protein
MKFLSSSSGESGKFHGNMMERASSLNFFNDKLLPYMKKMKNRQMIIKLRRGKTRRKKFLFSCTVLIVVQQNAIEYFNNGAGEKKVLPSSRT